VAHPAIGGLYANQPGGESGTGCLVKVFDKKRVLFMVCGWLRHGKAQLFWWIHEFVR
jgi:hypothetical protein